MYIDADLLGKTAICIAFGVAVVLQRGIPSLLLIDVYIC